MGGCVELEKILSPVTLVFFEDNYFEKKPLLISRNDSSHFRDLLSIHSIDAYLERKDIRYPAIRLVKDGLELPQTDYLTSFPYGNKTFDGVIDNDSLFNLFNEGATIVFQAIHRTLPGLSFFCQQIEKYYNFPLQTNIYLTPKSSKGFEAHYDTHDVFILQVHGSKIWKVYDSPVFLPTEPFKKELFTTQSPQIEVELKEGDLLYIPRGFIHEAVTTSEVSMHITLGLLSYKWLDILSHLNKHAHKIRGFRESFRFDELTVETIEKNTRELVNELLASFEFHTIKDKFRDRFIKKGLTSDNHRLVDIIEADAITPATFFSFRNEISYALSELEDGILLSYYNKQVKFPVYVLDTLKTIINSDGFTAESLASDIDTAGKLVLCKKLLKEGFIKTGNNGN